MNQVERTPKKYKLASFVASVGAIIGLAMLLNGRHPGAATFIWSSLLMIGTHTIHWWSRG